MVTPKVVKIVIQIVESHDLARLLASSDLDRACDRRNLGSRGIAKVYRKIVVSRGMPDSTLCLFSPLLHSTRFDLVSFPFKGETLCFVCQRRTLKLQCKTLCFI